MKNKTTVNRRAMIDSIALGFALSTLALLPGCWPFGEKKSTSNTETQSETRSAESMISNDDPNIVAWIDGKPFLTVAMVDQLRDTVVKANPQFKTINPKELDKHLADSVVMQELVSRHIAEQKIDKDPEYQAELAEAQKNVKASIDFKYLNKQISVSANDNEIQDFYEKNKQNPGIMISQGGSKTVGVQFDSEAAANAFLPKAKMANGDLEKTAKAAGIHASKIRDFKLVNEQSLGIDPVLKAKIVAIDVVPTTQVIKVDDKTFWVVHVSAKEAPVYQELSKIRTQIIQVIEENKRMQELSKKLEELRLLYKVKLNDNYFGGAAAEDAAQQPMVEEIDAFEDGK